MAAIDIKDVPVVSEQPATVREHIEMYYANGPSDWVLVNVGDGLVSVCHSGMDRSYYEVLHGPFNAQEIIVGLTALARRKTIVPNLYDLEYSDLDDKGFVFDDGGDDRVALKTGEDTVTIMAPCGDAYSFTLSKLIAVLKRSRTLAVVVTDG